VIEGIETLRQAVKCPSGNANLVLDSGPWVWVSLWFPLDTLLFTPLPYGTRTGCSIDFEPPT
jgi:hypothetical protein